MKYACILSVVVAAAIAQDFYEMDLGDFRVEDVAANKEELKRFIDCFIEEAPCTGVSAELKKYARDVVTLSCSKCTDEQKHIGKVFFEAFTEKLPKDFEKFKAFYDPEGKYIAAFAAAVANY